MANGNKCFFGVYLLLETNNLETETKSKYSYDPVVSIRLKCFCLFDAIRHWHEKKETSFNKIKKVKNKSLEAKRSSSINKTNFENLVIKS